MRLLFAAALIASASTALATEITVRGTKVDVDEQSVKCEVKAPSVVSTKRLAGCDSATAITIPKTGTKLVKFEIEPGDPSISQGQRAELRDMFEAKNGDETWYRFKTLLPLDYPFDDRSRVVTAQWHERMPDGDDHKRPPLAHRVVGRGFLVTLWDDKAFDASKGTGDGVVLVNEPTIKPGVAYEYVYRFVWRPDEKGVVTGWRREETCDVAQMKCTPGPWAQYIDYKGPVGFKTAAGYYFKLGVYTTHKFATPLVVYHNGYRRGPTAASVGATDAMFKAPRVSSR
jgi:hypothetical protein